MAEASNIGLLPREKMQSVGVEYLTTPELLSIILGSGSQHTPVHALSQKISDQLLHHHPLKLEHLLHIKGIGIAKACQVVAAIELVERLRPLGSPVLDSLEKVLQQVGELCFAEREQVTCLYLNARMQLLIKETVAVGSLNQANIHPRDIFRVIKYHPVLYVILVHNHPSGDPSPSQDDDTFTHNIFEAGQLLGIEVLDHVIVAHRQHYSYREQKKVLFGK